MKSIDHAAIAATTVAVSEMATEARRIASALDAYRKRAHWQPETEAGLHRIALVVREFSLGVATAKQALSKSLRASLGARS